LTNKEIETTRCVIAQAINLPPDDIATVTLSEDTPSLFSLDNYNGFNLLLGFDKIPTISEAKESIKDLYLAAIELDWEENIPI
jgi:hypothetical protein